jgi:hypothetical protein
MKPTIGYDYSRPGELVTQGNEAMIKVEHTGEVTLHPDLVAYGTADVGWLVVHGWQGSLGYQRGFGRYGNTCIGDAVCDAIERGQIPLRPRDELPENFWPGWSSPTA